VGCCGVRMEGGRTEPRCDSVGGALLWRPNGTAEGKGGGSRVEGGPGGEWRPRGAGRRREGGSGAGGRHAGTAETASGQ
jgi:hypothetical protein